MKRSLVYLFVCVLAAACSETESEKVEFDFTPNSPIVRSYDDTVPIGTDDDGNLKFEDITGPWFKFTINIQNGSTKGVVVDKLTLTIRGLSLTAGMITTTSTLSAADYIQNKDDDQNVPGAGDYRDQHIQYISAGASGLTFELYVESLSPLVTSGVYDVEVLAEGWFGTPDDPQAEYSQKYFFTTQ